MVFGTMAMDVTGEYGEADILIVHKSDKPIPELNYKLYDVYRVDLIGPNSEVDPSYDCILIFTTDPETIEKDVTDVCNDVIKKFNKGVK